MEKEIEALGGVLENPDHPFGVMLGGAKVSDKMGVLENLVDKVDVFLIGGGMAATFLEAEGYDVGESKVENDRLDYVKDLKSKATSQGVKILLPGDVIITQQLESGAETRTVPVGSIPKGWLIGDIGPETISKFTKSLKECRTVVWNGPPGVFEVPELSNGTNELAKSIASLKGTTVIGGGSTAEAVIDLGLAEKMSHVSTGGGASLEFMEGKSLPGIEVLMDKKS
jgi:phosphoglycerate kinase